jgi:hypothetical protein
MVMGDLVNLFLMLPKFCTSPATLNLRPFGDSLNWIFVFSSCMMHRIVPRRRRKAKPFEEGLMERGAKKGNQEVIP